MDEGKTDSLLCPRYSSPSSWLNSMGREGGKRASALCFDSPLEVEELRKLRSNGRSSSRESNVASTRD